MKIQSHNSRERRPRAERSEDGMATVIFIALLAIMMILVTAESRALVHLHREVKLLEQQQIKRLNRRADQHGRRHQAGTKMNNDLAAAKIKMMKASMRCLVFGLLGLLPVIGLPFALAALWAVRPGTRQERDFWNPAKPYRFLALVCAAFGALIWSAVDTVLIYNVLQQLHQCVNGIHAFGNFSSTISQRTW